MLRPRDTVGMSMAVCSCAAQEQEATGAALVHVDTKLCGNIVDTADDDRKRMLEEDMRRESEQKGPGADDDVDVGVDSGH